MAAKKLNLDNFRCPIAVDRVQRVVEPDRRRISESVRAQDPRMAPDGGVGRRKAAGLSANWSRRHRMDKVTVNRAAKALAERRAYRPPGARGRRAIAPPRTDGNRAVAVRCDRSRRPRQRGAARIEPRGSRTRNLACHSGETDVRCGGLWLIASIARRLPMRCGSSLWAN
jgi:hypothetical protein